MHKEIYEPYDMVDIIYKSSREELDTAMEERIAEMEAKKPYILIISSSTYISYNVNKEELYVGKISYRKRIVL